MIKISQEQQNKLEKVQKLLEKQDFSTKMGINPQLLILDELEKLNESLRLIAEKETPQPPEQKEFPTSLDMTLKGVEVVTLKGETGEKGDKGDKGDAGENGTNGKDGKNGTNGKDGKNGTNGKDGKNGTNGKDGKDGSSDTGEQILDKINDDESEKKIKREKVEGLDEELKSIRALPRGTGGGGGNKGVRFYPLTADGSTKIFTVPKSVVSKISMSDFPHVLFEGSGFTINATRTQITLTTDNAPSLGSQLLYEYQQMFGI